MDKIIKSAYKEYGIEDNQRMLPLIADGLRPAERRLLYSAYQIARTKYKKSQTVDAHCTGHFHPHGSSYGTLVQLVQQGFLTGQGNFGTNIGIEPTNASAPRYTECKIAEETINLAFKLINYVPYRTCEVDSESKEPLFLPTMFPFCFLGNKYMEGIGFGYKSLIPCYTKKDLYNRLLWLLGLRKSKPVIKPVTNCEIISSDKDLNDLCEKGQAQIKVKGKYEINKKDFCLYIKSWPIKMTFQGILNKLEKELANQDIGFNDLSSNGQTIIQIGVLKQRYKQTIFNKLVNKIDSILTGSIHFQIVIMESRTKVKICSVDEVLLYVFNLYKTINSEMLKSEISKTENIIKEYIDLDKIRKVLPEYINKSISDVDKAITNISKKTNLSEDVVKTLINKYKIRKLLSMDLDTETFKEKKNQMENNLKNIQEYVLQDYSNMIKE